MRIAVEGCAHGELEKIYDTIEALASMSSSKIDLLICCGDFQATRNLEDLESMAVPPKYREMCTFYKYYTGEKIAPILTIFVGGNHEASNHLQELPYGGWVAPNIYYLGYSGVVNIGGIRIAGISGIFKGHDHHRGRFEKVPYTKNTIRSVYHVRNLDVFRLKQMSSPIDIAVSHDWPQGVYNYGDKANLVRMKPFFKDEVQDDKLGSPVNSELLYKLKPKYWFSAHLHVKFAAVIPHKNEDGKVESVTKFLALDKCLPKRQFLQVLEIEHDPAKELEIEYDLEWLTILHYTNHLICVDSGMNYLPNAGRSDERWIFTPTEEEKNFILEKMENDLKVPKNFKATVPGYNQESSPSFHTTPTKGRKGLNPQTVTFCQKLGIDDPLALLLEKEGPGRTPDGGIGDISDPNLSFIDSEISGVCSGSDENDKSENSESEKDLVESPSNCRSPMKLPAPKFVEEVTPDERPESSINATQAKDQGSPPLFIIDEGSKRSVDETPISTPSQGTKKFKRRNQSLYMNED
ncbi:Lariat debranching enzyme [Nesidiocoris tenuis]|uniref:Lariat debranching enzyme n=1 Tax=Nesidiocoris tenuis TaxID=355587 RepID=A0ABN7BIM5_9HEMI|nr:Lariat debranching enzyme [Nesidiocoris tenuis]